MKTSIADTIKIERFLTGEMDARDRLVFEAKLLVDQQLRTEVSLQRMVHKLVRLYHRKKLKARLEVVHERLFSDPANTSLRETVELFKS